MHDLIVRQGELEILRIGVDQTERQVIVMVFADILGLPTVWVPHSYPACSQHAPDEHLLVPVVREALQLMAGLFWDLGEQAATLPRKAG
jgi:hypothetical protein